MFENTNNTKFTETNHLFSNSEDEIKNLKKGALFSRIPSTVSQKSYHHILRDYELLSLNTKTLLNILNDATENIRLRIPIHGKQFIDLELTEVDITSEGYRLMTSKEEYQSTINRHFRGSIKGEHGSLVTLSLSTNGVYGMFNSHSGSFTLGLLEDGSEDYIVYNSNTMKVSNPFRCHTSEKLNDIPNSVLHKAGGSPNVCRFVKLYWEADHELYQNYGTISGTESFIQAIFNQMAILYENEGIVMELSELKVWDSPDNYGDEDSETALNSFKNRWNTQGDDFNGDLAHLVALDSGNNGGRARVNALCNKPFAHAYSNINLNYDNVPTYSWTVNVLAHETGHNLGSQHTHACAWNGDNTKIDNCGGQYDPSNNDNDCAGNPPPPSAGGTVMSYCHLLPSVSIDFVEGFHPQVAEFIQDKINNAICLEVLPSCANDINLTKDNHSIGFSETELSMNVDVINEGFITSNASKIGYYASKDENITTDDILLGLDDIESLTWGAITAKDFTVDLCDIDEIQSDSAYYLGYIIDQEYIIQETNENDNAWKLTNYPQTIVCVMTAITEEIEDWINFDLFPNPAFDHISVIASLEKRQAIEINIYNVLGQQIYYRNLGQTNYIEENIILEHLPNGTYFMELNVGTNHLSRKFVMVR